MFNVISTDHTSNSFLAFFGKALSYFPNEFIKYFFASGFAFAIDIGFLYLLTEIFSIHYLLSATIGTIKL
jgi:putative flippase GtrA